MAQPEQPKQVEFYKLDARLAQGILNYLSAQPYKEVALLIQGLGAMSECNCNDALAPMPKGSGVKVNKEPAKK